MTRNPQFDAPPENAQRNHDGGPRRVGVEIEFAAVTARQAAEQVRSLFGGVLSEHDRHLYDVTGTELGDFRCKLDFQYAHAPDHPEQEAASKGTEKADLFEEFKQAMRDFLGDVGALMAPCEIVCPPVTLADLPRLEALREALRESGAEGTDTGLIYAFGAQLNPEIASREADYLTAILKAYMLLSGWLRAQIQVDFTRALLAFADPFPPDYVALVLERSYWPAMSDLIDHYVAYNPTRNREIDLLPLFDWIDSARVRAVVGDTRIKPRPAFHYRLPNAHIQRPDWSLAAEWNRWCKVEHLAADRDRLEEAATAYRQNLSRFIPEPWEHKVGRYIGAS